jgi:hypothetical protein
MHLTSALILALSTLSLAIPLPTSTSTRLPRQASILQTRPYSAFQISDNAPGNALSLVSAAFPVPSASFATISSSDLSILKDAREISEDAEVGDGGFNDAIAAAEAAGDDTTALQAGKIMNKVLKLQLSVLVLEIEAAQGDGDDAKLQEQLTKLGNNVAIDEGNAGGEAVGVTDSFVGAGQAARSD